MVRVPRLAPVAVLFLLSAGLLAGCSGPTGTESAAPAPAGPPEVTTVVGQTPQPLYTDTVHLLQPPSFTTKAPAPGKPVRIAIPAFTGRSDFADTWDVRLQQDTQALQGQAVLYGEVVGTVLNDPFPTAGGCFWSFSVSWDSLDPNAYRTAPCGVEGATVAPGIRQLAFPLDVAGPWPAGTVLRFEFHVQDFARSPGAEVNLLTASADYDSILTIAGLDLAVGPSLLPATTDA